MELPPFLTRTASGDIDLTGHRIGLYSVVRWFSEGESAEMLAVRFPTLRLGLIYSVLGFYLDHRAEVDDYCRAYRADLAAQETAAPPSNLAELRARMDAARRAELRPGAYA